MAKGTSKRKTEKLSQTISKEDFDEALKQFSAKSIELDKKKADLEEELQEIREDYATDIELLAAKQKAHFATIKAYCIEHREELLVDKAKSFDTLYGKIGFRKDPPSIKTASGVTVAILLTRLKEAGLNKYIRTVEEPNKELLLADRDTDIKAKFPELGIKVSADESFYIDLKKEEVPA